MSCQNIYLMKTYMQKHETQIGVVQDSAITAQRHAIVTRCMDAATTLAGFSKREFKVDEQVHQLT